MIIIKVIIIIFIITITTRIMQGAQVINPKQDTLQIHVAGANHNTTHQA
jgi:hypothetical protein